MRMACLIRCLQKVAVGTIHLVDDLVNRSFDRFTGALNIDQAPRLGWSQRDSVEIAKRSNQAGCTKRRHEIKP